MIHHRDDWLDRLAVRSLPRPARAAHRGEAALAPERQFSRATAVKLALAGAASLALGLGTAPTARAQDRGECFTQCLNSHDKELKRRLQSCDDVFRPKKYDTSDWRLYAKGFFAPTQTIAMAGVSLAGLCYAKAKWEVGGDKNDCYDRCETTCRRRSLQSSSGRSGATCEVTPPHEAPPPTVPPIPHPTEGVAAECANCASVGGECCYGDDPTHLCGCAGYDPEGPETACQRVGCK